MKKNKGWIKLKRYPHIGLPIEVNDIPALCGYIKNPQKIAHHAFFPLIHRTMVSFPFKGNPRKRKRKERHICFATHLDAQIYSYYNKILAEAYEQKIKDLNLEDVAIAYRSIPVDKTSRSNKSHIHFSKEVFDFIKTKTNEVGYVNVVVSDISSFFDSLDHKILKERWKEVLNVRNLSEDVYNVYKNLTRFSYIDEKSLLDELKNKVIVQEPNKKNQPIINRKRHTKHIASKVYFRKNNVIAYCERADISKLRHLITCRPFDCKTKKYVRNSVGIPQGLPISATLANVYMLHFDQAMRDFADSMEGMYRR